MDWLDEGQAEDVAREEFAFLVFEHAGSRFGVEVDQVEALVSLPQPPAAGEPVTCEYEGQPRPAQALSAWLGWVEAGTTPSRVLFARHDGALRAFLVDTPRDILTLPLEAVYPMPPLVKRVLGTSPFWGVGYDKQSENVILLVDLGARRLHTVDTASGKDSGGEI